VSLCETLFLHTLCDEGKVREDTILFGGSANPALAEAVARELGVPLSPCEVERFPDGELTVRLGRSVRRCEVFVIQPTAPPVNDHLVELLAFADACRRSAAARVVAVVPYFGYARGDKREGRRVPVTASLVAALMETAGVSQVLTVDIHSAQMEGFFRIPMDTLSAVPLLCGALEGRLPEGTTVVSPDAGRVKTASEFAERLGLPLTVLSKHRESGTRTRVTHIVGDVRGRPCLIVDDMISTGGTIAESAEALRGAGASGPFIVVATHGLLMGDACRRMAVHGVEEIVLTDSVPERPVDGMRLRTVTLAPLLAEGIRRAAGDARSQHERDP
jgi:ribose-phosphate pyrophosphokinase